MKQSNFILINLNIKAISVFKTLQVVEICPIGNSKVIINTFSGEGKEIGTFSYNGQLSTNNCPIYDPITNTILVIVSSSFE